MSVFDGTQPTFTQVPPSVPPSTIATRAPRSAPLMAAANPAEPPPTTSRSNSPPPLVIPAGASDPSDSSRSEEHTSELQSLAYLVCRLLLEKKKKTKNPETIATLTITNKRILLIE